MAKTFFGNLTYKDIMNTYNECCFGMLHPKWVRANVNTWRKLMHKILDLVDPRYPVLMVADASIQYDSEIPEGEIHFIVGDARVEDAILRLRNGQD